MDVHGNCVFNYCRLKTYTVPKSLHKVFPCEVQQVHILVHHGPIEVVRVPEVVADDGPVQPVVVLVEELCHGPDVRGEEAVLLQIVQASPRLLVEQVDPVLQDLLLQSSVN